MVGQKEVLIEASQAAIENAYAPYSGFRVGAAVIAESGQIYPGCNVENASYGLSICAERAAISQAICAGERKIRAVAISGSSNEIAFPCGACLQVITEFATPEETVNVYLVSKDRIESYTLAELLPRAFEFKKE